MLGTSRKPRIALEVTSSRAAMSHASSQSIFPHPSITHAQAPAPATGSAWHPRSRLADRSVSARAPDGRFSGSVQTNNSFNATPLRGAAGSTQRTLSHRRRSVGAR